MTMPTADVDTAKPVGEFGSKPWCEACGVLGMQMLEAADLPPDLSWAFSERYTCPPPRLLSDDWPASGYHFMVLAGRITGGGGVPKACLAVPGFHPQLRWAFICNQSGARYGRAGQKQRAAEEQQLRRDLAAHLGAEPDLGGIPAPFWPQPIVAALSVGMEEGGGLHNLAADLLLPSPEFADLPVTELGVPVFPRMTPAQQAAFLALCGLQPPGKAAQ